MKLAFISLAFAGILFTADSAGAAGWSRNGSVSTPRGVYSRSVSGNCSPGHCARSASTTGPQGRTVTRTSGTNRRGPHIYGHWRTVAGPSGGSATRRGFVRAYPYY
jgi:hypothetical protein